MPAKVHVLVKLKQGMIPPKMLGTFIDRVTITCNLPPHMRTDMISQLKELEENNKKKVTGSNPHTPFGNYQMSQWMPLKGPLVGPNGDKTGDTRLLVQCVPKHGYANIKFSRFDWNPAHTEPETLAVALDLLAPGLYDYLMQHATITRLDLAVDVAYLPINLCLFTLPGSSISRTYGKSGKTIELGSKGSTKQFVAYDKVAQIKARNKMKAPWAQEPVPKFPNHPHRVTPAPQGIAAVGGAIAAESVCIVDSVVVGTIGMGYRFVAVVSDCRT